MGFIFDLLKDIPLSAVIKERLTEAEKKVSVLEQQIHSLESENFKLKTENKNLKINLDQANREIDRLNEIIISLQESQSIKKLDETENKILRLLFETNQEFHATAISDRFNINIGIAEYHINNLLEAKFINAEYRTSEPTYYYITTKGREYIVKNT